METIEIKEYKVGDKVRVLMNNPRENNRDEWRDAEVVRIQTVYPSYGSHHAPYPMLIVKVIRTYCKATDNFKMLDGVKVYSGSTLEFFDKENEEGVIYSDQIMLKDKRKPEEVLTNLFSSIYNIPEELRKKKPFTSKTK
jgi:hypothetical protein